MTAIKDSIKKLAEKEGEFYSVIGVVTSVDKEKKTCDVTPLSGNAEIFDVRLQSTLKMDKGITTFPVKGSNVLVTFINNETGYVAMFEEIESFEIVIGKKQLFFDKNGLHLESETSDLKKEMNSLVSLLDSILGTLLQFKVIAPTGPTTVVMPDTIAKLQKHKVDLKKFKSNLNTIIT